MTGGKTGSKFKRNGPAKLVVQTACFQPSISTPRSTRLISCSVCFTAMGISLKQWTSLRAQVRIRTAIHLQQEEFSEQCLATRRSPTIGSKGCARLKI